GSGGAHPGSARSSAAPQRPSGSRSWGRRGTRRQPRPGSSGPRSRSSGELALVVGAVDVVQGDLVADGAGRVWVQVPGPLRAVGVGEAVALPAGHAAGVGEGAPGGA